VDGKSKEERSSQGTRKNKKLYLYKIGECGKCRELQLVRDKKKRNKMKRDETQRVCIVPSNIKVSRLAVKW